MLEGVYLKGLNKIIIFFLLIVLSSCLVSATDKFIFQVNITEENQNFTFRLDNPTMSIDWGDGNNNTFTSTGLTSHQYSTPGIYNVSLNGSATRIAFGEPGTTPKLFHDILTNVSPAIIGLNSTLNMFRETNVTSFSEERFFDVASNNITTMNRMFYNSTFNGNISSWDVSSVTDFQWMFNRAKNFNQDIGSWNTSNVENMYAMFYYATNFNQSIGEWDVSSVTNMDRLFYEADKFTQDISLWNTSNVVNMDSMFYGGSFNGNISEWDVSKVTDMTSMFLYSQFNQSINKWDVSKVNSMRSMFSNSKFNQDISSWNVSSVTLMNNMFLKSPFNQDISSWNVSSVTNMTAMFSLSKLSTQNYDALLIGWNSLPTLQNNVSFHAGTSQYCLGENARNNLTNTSNYNWTITDAGRNCTDFLSITYPTNTTYSSNVTSINYTFSNILDYCWYSYTFDTGNSSGGSASSIYVLAGTNFTTNFGNSYNYNVFVYCNDSNGNIINDSVSFTIDKIPPIITINSPLNNTNITSSSLQILLNVTFDEIIDYAKYRINDLNLSYYLCGNCTSALVNVTLPNFGINTIQISANDLNSNSNLKNTTFNLVLNTTENLSDSIIGTINNVITNFNNISFFVNQSDNLSQTFNSTLPVIIKEDNDTIVEFNFNFLNNSIILPNIVINKYSDIIGQIIIKGLNLSDGITKTVYVDRIINTTNYSSLCIKDSEILDIREISDGCNEDDETLINCPETRNGYTCTEHNSTSGKQQWKVTGLTHSGIVQACTESWTCSDWSVCSSSSQSRTCTDGNSCGTIVYKPATTQSCGSSSPPSSYNFNQGVFPSPPEDNTTSNQTQNTSTNTSNTTTHQNDDDNNEEISDNSSTISTNQLEDDEIISEESTSKKSFNELFNDAINNKFILTSVLSFIFVIFLFMFIAKRKGNSNNSEQNFYNEEFGQQNNIPIQQQTHLSYDEELRNYVFRNRNKGHNDEEIKDFLIKHGVQKEKIEETFNKI